jgi:DNA repair photolyase
MVDIIFAERKSSVLSSSSLACLSRTPSLNLTSGCAHNCIYCYARGYSTYPGENKVIIYKNTLDKLTSELLHKKNKPQAVYFSPSSDIFQPIPEVLKLSHSVLEFLLTRGIGVAFLTKGYIPDKTLGLLFNHADRVRAQIGIITHDDNIRRIFEPNTASVDVRFKQMARMTAGGITTEARIVPILPGITDVPDSINCLYGAISKTGVKHAAISILFLRPAITASLKRSIFDKEALEYLLTFYKDSRRLAVHAEHSSIISLPRLKREEIYARFSQIARKYDIKLSICGCMNPDIGDTCNIAGSWLTLYTQRSLFEQGE